MVILEYLVRTYQALPWLIFVRTAVQQTNNAIVNTKRPIAYTREVTSQSLEVVAFWRL